MNLRVSKRWLWWIREWSSRYHRSMWAEEMCKMGNWVGTRKQAMVVEVIIIMKPPSLGGQSRCPGRRSIASDKVSKPFLALSCARCCFNRISLLRLLARPAQKIRIFPRVFSSIPLEISNAGKWYICIRKKKKTPSSMMDGSFEREAHRNLWPPFLPRVWRSQFGFRGFLKETRLVCVMMICKKCGVVHFCRQLVGGGFPFHCGSQQCFHTRLSSSHHGIPGFCNWLSLPHRRWCDLFLQQLLTGKSSWDWWEAPHSIPWPCRSYLWYTSQAIISHVYRELELKLTCYYWWQDAKKHH